ncbi:MAG: aldehyde dehydrogenase family protein [Candidatus Nanopelagicales bacterium]
MAVPTVRWEVTAPACQRRRPRPSGWVVITWWQDRAMATYTSRNPARIDDVVTEVPQATSPEVLAACESAHSAQPGWAAVPAPARGRVIAQVGRLFEANKESLSRLVTREMGKVYAEALGDVQEVIDTCDFFLGEGRRLYGQTIPSEMPDKMTVAGPVMDVFATSSTGRRLVSVK